MIIGLTGKAGAGKDTVADILCKRYNFERYAMAKPLKQMLASVGFTEPPRELKESPIPGFNFSWRTAAQRLGTEWGRGLDEDIWLKFAELFIAGKYEQHKNVVITDIRFPNEEALIKRYFGRLYVVVGRESKLDASAATHISEIAQFAGPISGVIDNSGSIDDLAREIHYSILELDTVYGFDRKIR